MGQDKHEAKRAARLCAVQALYQMDIATSDLDTTIEQFREHQFNNDVSDFKEVDGDYFEFIVRGVFDHQSRIDKIIDEHLSVKWRLSRLDSTLRALLRCGVQELLHTPDITSAILIKQYVDMAHAFFADAEGGMANAVLDKIAKDLQDAKDSQDAKNSQNERV